MAREPASIRYKNPGAMWGGNAISKKWGEMGNVSLNDGTGQGNKIAVFPTFVQGICAQIDLWRSKRYKNKRFDEAIKVWSGGNSVASYIKFVRDRVPGMTAATIINDAFLKSPMGIQFLKAQAWHEAGKKYPAPDADWIEAQQRVFGGSKTAQAPAVAPVTAPAPVSADKPGLWTTLWRAVRGKDARADTTPEKVRPGLKPGGDPAVWDQQDLLSTKGYTEVGGPDGYVGIKTVAAIRAFRAENGLPKSDVIDARFTAALASAGPRQVSAARVETTASDLRENGNSQVATLDSFGWVGKLLLGGGLLGGVDQSGVLGKANETLQSAQDTLGTITTVFTTIINVATWCFAHWWIFALGGGLYVLFKVAMGVLNVVVLFRQGFLARADR